MCLLKESHDDIYTVINDSLKILEILEILGLIYTQIINVKLYLISKQNILQEFIETYYNYTIFLTNFINEGRLFLNEKETLILLKDLLKHIIINGVDNLNWSIDKAKAETSEQEQIYVE